MNASKIVFRPVGLVAGALAGVAAGAVFKQVWKVAAGEDEAPKALDEGRSWVEILAAAAVQGAIFSIVKAAVDRGAARGVQKWTGEWPA